MLVRSLEQLRALRDQPVASVIADLDQPTELREAVAIDRGCWLAGARVTRPSERWTLEPLVQVAPDGYLKRNADQLEVLTALAPCYSDFPLNVANPVNAAWFLDHWKLQRITASYDLDLKQMLELVRGCLFYAFLSSGHDHTDCGRPCEKHTMRADLGCRNTLFNGQAQTTVEACLS